MTRAQRFLRVLPFINLMLLGVVILLFSILLTNEQDRNDRIEQAAEIAKVAADKSRRVAARIERETRERRDAACSGAERQHAQEVTELGRTYALLRDPPPEFAGLLMNPLVLQGVREEVRVAQKDTDRFGVFVSPFCDDPGIGEPEGDPKVPAQPEAVTKLLEG